MNKNKDEFIKILEEHKRIIYKICNTYCRNKEEQKDLFQDIVIQLWKNFEKYNPEYKLTTWIYRIGLNVAISSYRKSLTRKKHTSSIDLDFVQVAAEVTEDQDKDLQLLLGFISQLNEMNKALMILYLEGNSHQEISEVLQISTTNVGTKISRIKRKLKDQFSKK